MQNLTYLTAAVWYSEKVDYGWFQTKVLKVFC